VILDEVNLAEPQILKRPNSLLKRDPSLVLTESDGSVLGPGGTPIHPDFRVFATMNPAEYAGRAALSPAHRNRWRGYRMVPDPDERGYLAMTRRLVFGVQPDVHAQGRTWAGLADGVATHGVLASVPQVDGLLEALVCFQVALENATGQRFGSRARIGARRKERYVFTRRDLLSVLDYLASPLTIGSASTTWTFREAIQRYYLGRVQTAEDRRLVACLLDAAGIGPRTWSAGTGAATKTEKELPATPDPLAEFDAARRRLVAGLAALASVREGVDAEATRSGPGSSPRSSRSTTSASRARASRR